MVMKRLHDLIFFYHPSGSPGLLFCSNRMVWYSEPYQHALFFAPKQLYNPNTDEYWTDNTELLDHLGHTRDVFYSSFEDGAPEIHYAGTYVCRQIEDLSVKEYQQLDIKVRCRHAQLSTN